MNAVEQRIVEALRDWVKATPLVKARQERKKVMDRIIKYHLWDDCLAWFFENIPTQDMGEETRNQIWEYLSDDSHPRAALFAMGLAMDTGY